MIFCEDMSEYAAKPAVSYTSASKAVHHNLSSLKKIK